ncbi:ABC transporter permease [Fulvivirga sp. M361]|uniref:ABC transporter permease n=1 Tax=Fulvivirga sp. M361 TaxID=2594266 RepID=UPI00117A3E23|nr:ABC transporter permease [Fulvivirga sp. M361]TRX58223.1 ABC transporter permease [Fulvivirga sp. M361]
MNFSYFISKKVSKGATGTFSATIHKIAVGSIAIGLAVMIVSFLILKGFQSTVTEKIYSFSAHIQVTKYTLGNSYDEVPISLNNILFQSYGELDQIDHVQEYSHKAGLLKTKEEILGVVFKGVGKSFDLSRFGDNLVEGRFVDFSVDSYSKEVVISRIIADKLQLAIDDDIIVHFFMQPPRPRKLKVVGIYETNLSDYYDDKFILGDIRLVQRLNSWPDSLAGGMEVFVKNTQQVDKAESLLDDLLDFDLFVEKISDKYIQVFEWLFLIDRQVNIFLGIILLVVCVNMVSIILILIMERTRMIGLLKAFGATNRQIRGIFTYNGISLVLKGLIGGNFIGLGICFIQYYLKVIPLNPNDYYMSYVPIGWDWQIILTLNLLTFTVVSLIVMLPGMIIVRVNPIKSIRFD